MRLMVKSGGYYYDPETGGVKYNAPNAVECADALTELNSATAKSIGQPGGPAVLFYGDDMDPSDILDEDPDLAEIERRLRDEEGGEDAAESVAKGLPSLGEIGIHRGGTPRKPVQNPGARGGKFHWTQKGGVEYGDEPTGRRRMKASKPDRASRRRMVLKQRKAETGSHQAPRKVPAKKAAASDPSKMDPKKAAKGLFQSLKTQYSKTKAALVKAFRTIKHLPTKAGLFYTALRVSQTYMRFEHWCTHHKLDAEELVNHALMDIMQGGHAYHELHNVIHELSHYAAHAAEFAMEHGPEIVQAAEAMMKSERPALDAWLDSLPKTEPDFSVFEEPAPAVEISGDPGNPLVRWLMAKAQQLGLFDGPIEPGKIKHGGKVHMGVDKIGRKHWRANPETPTASPPAPPPSPPPPPEGGSGGDGGDSGGEEPEKKDDWALALAIGEAAWRNPGLTPERIADIALAGQGELESTTTRELARLAADGVMRFLMHAKEEFPPEDILPDDDDYSSWRYNQFPEGEDKAKIERLEAATELATRAAQALAGKVLFAFWIPGGAREVFEGKIKALNKRAKRLKVPPIEYNFTDSETRQLWSYTGDSFYHKKYIPVGETLGKPWETHGYRQDFYRVQVKGESPYLEGFEFIARIEHGATSGEDAEVGNLIHRVPGAKHKVPEKYRDAPADCDHCGVSRRRNDTFIVYETDTGDLKQVGRTCLKDYMHNNADPEALARHAELLAEAMTALKGAGDEYDDLEPGEYRSAPTHIALDEFLPWVAKLIREEGYQNARGEYPTGQAAVDAMDAYHSNKIPAKKKPVPPTDADHEVAKKALQYTLDIPEEEMHKESDYADLLYNMNLLARRGTIKFAGKRNHRGIAAWMVGRYLRETQQKIEREAEEKAGRASEHIGTIGKRMRGLEVTCTGRRGPFESQWGSSFLFQFIDSDGNRLKWWTSNGDAFEEGDKAIIDATPKEHDTYKGNKETVVTRVSMITPPAVPWRMGRPFQEPTKPDPAAIEAELRERGSDKPQHKRYEGTTSILETPEEAKERFEKRLADEITARQEQYDQLKETFDKQWKSYGTAKRKFRKQYGSNPLFEGWEDDLAAAEKEAGVMVKGSFGDYIRDLLGLWPDEETMAKSTVRAHDRTDKTTGKTSHVGQYTDKRTKKPEESGAGMAEGGGPKYDPLTWKEGDDIPPPPVQGMDPEVHKRIWLKHVAEAQAHPDDKVPDAGESARDRHITIHQGGPDSPGKTIRMRPHPDNPGRYHIHPDDLEAAGQAFGRKVKAGGPAKPKIPAREQFEDARLPRGPEWGDGDGVVYHVTSYGRLADILKSGLDPAKAQEEIEGVDSKFGGAKQEYSKGKIFFADTKEAATSWWGHLEDIMLLSTDDPNHQARVMLRVQAPEDLAPDAEGSQDVSESSFSTSTIPPEAIEYWDGKHWIAANQKAMTQGAKGAPPAEEEANADAATA